MKQKNKVILVISLLLILISCTSISKNEKVGEEWRYFRNNNKK